MSRYDFAAQRLFVEAPLATGSEIAPSPAQINYLINVLRLRAGDAIILFNGRDGEYRAELCDVTRRALSLRIGTQLRSQTPRADLDYCFAPLKQARQDYMAQKATEMGAGRLVPVITHRTQARRVNDERLRANAIEAAEQCGVLAVPEVTEAVTLDAFLAAFAAPRLLVFCDEDAETKNPVEALAERGADHGVSLLIGPEGGFDECERAAIMRLPNVARLALGPRILRADTAAVAALAVVQCALGDWRDDKRRNSP